MRNEIQISEKYRKRINLYFVQDWFLLGAAILAMLYLLLNYISSNSFIIFGIDREISLYLSIILALIFIVKFFFISTKIKKRLIYKVIDEKDFYCLILYNKTSVKLAKTLIPLYKYSADYFINTLFGVGGTIHLTSFTRSERYIVIINNRKYYFLPFLFEVGILI